ASSLALQSTMERLHRARGRKRLQILDRICRFDRHEIASRANAERRACFVYRSAIEYLASKRLPAYAFRSEQKESESRSIHGDRIFGCVEFPFAATLHHKAFRRRIGVRLELYLRPFH